jgi:adenine phosphoribosyltransferase
MNEINLDDYIYKVPDFPKKGILFYDITGVLTSPKAFSYCIDRMVEIYKDKKFDAVAAIEARGFIFAAPFAYCIGLPLILVRKKGKLPRKTTSETFELEYGTAEIELNHEDIRKGSNILMVDDLIATGGTLRAACNLLTNAGAAVHEIFGVMGLPFLEYSKKLDGIKVTTLIDYNAE